MSKQEILRRIKTLEGQLKSLRGQQLMVAQAAIRNLRAIVSFG